MTNLLPSFALADADFSKKVLMKHTVCACTGLPRQDFEFLFEYANATPEARVEAMKSMKPTTGFGETFQYSNSMVAAGGYIAAHSLDPKKRLGPGYDAAMQAHVFDPLGMKSTTLDIAIAKRREHASPHGENLRGEYTPMQPSDEGFVVPVRPAGAAWSNTTDMTKYLMLELAKGRDGNGKQLVSEKNLLKRREPQIKITDKVAYGLGLFVENDHGIPIVHHGGNTLGFTSDVYFLPEHGVGVVLLTNAANANTFGTVVRRRILEILFDAKENAARALAFAVSAKREALEKELSKISFGPDVEWAKGFAGTYTNDNLGSIAIRLEGRKATLDAGEWKSTLVRKNATDGTSKLVLLDAPVAGLEFLPSEKEGRKVLTLDAAQQQYIFEPSKAASAR